MPSFPEGKFLWGVTLQPEAWWAFTEQSSYLQASSCCRLGPPLWMQLEMARFSPEHWLHSAFPLVYSRPKELNLSILSYVTIQSYSQINLPNFRLCPSQKWLTWFSFLLSSLEDKLKVRSGSALQSLPWTTYITNLTVKSHALPSSNSYPKSWMENYQIFRLRVHVLGSPTSVCLGDGWSGPLFPFP